uniref:18S rRNA (guanine-N(7))-methyltransferase n=2 Tax=Bilateria TaxID=33213 RepID=F7G295_ORNAN
MASSGRRPEHRGPPELFYNEDEARKYTQNSRMIGIQTQMSERAVELLALPEEQPCFLLDIGCGSGLSGDFISEQGHHWVGIDISSAMLDVAVEREVEGDLLLGDMGQGVPFRPGTFDGCISISAVQWLCNADKKSHNPARRLFRFFSSLYAALVRPVSPGHPPHWGGPFGCHEGLPHPRAGGRRRGRACRSLPHPPPAGPCRRREPEPSLQLYPENAEQLELITAQAMKAGFQGGLVVDYPNSTKAKKFFLCLFAGVGGPLPEGLGSQCAEGEELKESKFSRERQRFKTAKGKSVKKSRDWVLEKKERRRRQGKEVRADTRYTGRKRRPRF